jgi:hypothetical protein
MTVPHNQTSIGPAAPLARPAVPALATAAGGTLPAATYFYRIIGVHVDGRVSVPSAPSVSIAVPGGGTASVTLTFIVPATCFGCAIYRGTVAGQEGLLVGVITASPYTDTGVAADNTHANAGTGSDAMGIAASPTAVQPASTVRPPAAVALAGVGRGQVSIT